MSIAHRLLLLLTLGSLVAACGSSSSPSTDGGASDAALSCEADSLRCDPVSRVPQTCSADGETWVDGEACASNNQCVEGRCVDLCAEAVEERSYMGCEYWPTSLGNARHANFGAEHPFVIALANPHPYEVTATVTGGRLTAATVVTIPGDQVELVTVEPISELTKSLSSRLEQSAAYRVVTNAPVAAYQFSYANGQLPDGGPGSTVNDASLLLPTGTLGSEYMVLAYTDAFYQETIRYGGLFAITATADVVTNVTVRASSGVSSGPGVSAFTAGQTQTFALERGDVLQLAGDNSGDLTGSLVTSDQPVAVFGGHIGAQVPQVSENLVDHVQEQLPPNESWGKEFVAANLAEIPTRLRVLAQSPNTEVSFSPSSVANTAQLGAGQFVEITVPANQAFAITATEPVLVAQYMESPGPNRNTYPSMVLVTPVEQYRSAVVLHTPESHPNSVLQLTGRADSMPVVDNDLVSELPRLIAGTDFAVWDVVVAPGRHTVSAQSAIGVNVFGLEGITTYAYPGGLDLNRIVID